MLINSPKEFLKLEEKTRQFYIYQCLNSSYNKIDKLTNKLDIYIDNHDETHRIMVENAEKKYATKLTEKIVYGLVGIITTAVVIALISGVVKAKEYFTNN